MRIYFDVSCLNRPFDDQEQTRIRLESAAIAVIFELIDIGQLRHVSSEMAAIEIDAISDMERQTRVRMLLPQSEEIGKLTSVTFRRAHELEELGFKPADAVHVAAGEELKADVLLTCDDRLCRLGKHHRQQLRVEVANPLDWIKEHDDDNDT